MASVAATPGAANLPLFVCQFCPRAEEVPPFEVVCSKPGYLASRLTFALEWALTVAAEEAPPYEPSAAETSGEVAGAAGSAVALGAAGSMGSMGALGAAALAPVLLPVAAVGLLVAMVATKDRPPQYNHAYRALPELLLIPATFGSESDCDAHFAALQTRLNATRDAQRSYIDAHCRFWPCKASDTTPCPDPVCERRRTIADEQLKSQLDQIPALRTQVRIAVP